MAKLSPAMTTACLLASSTARIEPVVLPSTVARVEGLVGRRDLPGATNAVDAVKPKGVHQVNRRIAQLKPKLWGRRVDRLHAHHLDLRRVRCRRLNCLRRRLRNCGERPSSRRAAQKRG